MGRKKKIALLAHYQCEQDLLEWVRSHREALAHHTLFGTGATGLLLAEALALDVHALLSGPLGGDEQLGAMIAGGGLDLVVLFCDPLAPQPSDPDAKALLRAAVLYDVPTACNRATADFLVSSVLLREPYERSVASEAASAPMDFRSA